MTVLSMSKCGTPSKSSSLALWLVMLVSLFAVGCGSSGGDDFVVVGNPNNNNPQVPTGAVTFQFARAQVDITATVPTATAKLHIDFVNAQNAKVFETSPDLDFAPTVTVSGVPVTATQAIVTALDANGIPVASIRFNLTVDANQSTNAVPAGPGFLVTFDSVTASPNPISLAVNATRQISLSLAFSNGSILSGTAAGGVASYNSSDIAVATVSPSGLVEAKGDGTATITVSYTLNGVTKTTTVTVNVSASGDHGGGTGNVSVNRLIASPTSVTLTNSSTSQKITATFFAANSTTGTTVTATGTLGGFTGGVNATNLTYVSSSGNVTSTAAVSGTATLTLSHTPTGGSPVNTTVAIAVNRAATGGGIIPPPGGTPARLEIAQTNLFVNAAGGTTAPLNALYFAANSTVGVTVPVGGLQGVAKNPNPAGTTDRWTFQSASSDVLASGTGGQPAENNTIQFTVTHTPTTGAAASADITVTAVGALDPRLTSIVSSQLVGPTSITLPSGARYPFAVINTLGNGTRVAAPVGTAAVGDVSIDPGSSSSIGTYGTGTYNNLTAAAVPATGTVTLRRLTALPGTFTPVATVNVSVVNTTLKSGGGANVVLTPSTNSVKGGEPLLYKIEWLFENESRLDVTSLYGYTNGGAINGFVADPASSLANGLAPTAAVGVPTPSTIGIGAVLLPDVALPAGTVVNGPDANINVIP